MTNKEAIAILKPLFEQCKGTDGCLGYIEHYFSKDEEKALDLAIKALQFAEEVIKITIEEDFPEYTDDRIRDLVDKEYNED